MGFVYQTKNPALGRVFCIRKNCEKKLALTRFHAGVLLVDHVNPTVAADNAAVFIAKLRGLKGIADLHLTSRLQN